MRHTRSAGLLALSLLALSSFGAVFVVVPAAPASAQAPPDNARRGVVHDGLVKTAADGACRGNFALASGASGKSGRARCTHGPDPAPDGVDVQRARPAAELQSATPAEVAPATSVPCYGNGTDGYRVQVIYARASNVADRYASLAGSFVTWSAAADEVARASAAETGGTRHFRYVTDPACNLVVDRVTLSTTGDDNFDNTVNELFDMGYDRADRKYLVYVDANVYCGIGEIYYDDSPNATPGSNYNNGHTQVQGMIARVDNGCWGQPNGSVEAHELMHNLGGVQPSAPHATPGLHCTDENDRMCYNDGSGGLMQLICALLGGENRFDCNHDDYFSTNPAAGSYLATHWNTANSAFLANDTVVPALARSWGYNVYGQLGDGLTLDKPLVADGLIDDVDSVSAGGYHTLAVKAGTVWAWGLGHVGQLGAGPGMFTSPTPVQVPGLSGVTAVSAGFMHSLALKSDGTVWAWGYNALGQLGDGTSLERYQPVKVPGLGGAVAISAGGLHSLALLSDGTIRAWGWNGYGQLGTGSLVSSSTPVKVSGSGYSSIAAGLYHSVAARTTGTVAAWGWNYFGQVGDGSTTDRALPATVVGANGVKSVMAGYSHSLGLGTDGQLRSWGLANVIGRGGGSKTAAVIPGLTGVQSASANGYHTLVVRPGGTVSSFGWNAIGQLGDGTIVDRVAPVAVNGLTGVTAVAAGMGHSLALVP